MPHSRVAVAFLLSALFLSPASYADKPRELRKWTSLNGEFSIEAEFVKFAVGKVTLKRRDGSLVVIDFPRLSKDDQKWIKDKPRRDRLAKRIQDIAESKKPTATPPSPKETEPIKFVPSIGDVFMLLPSKTIFASSNVLFFDELISSLVAGDKEGLILMEKQGRLKTCNAGDELRVIKLHASGILTPIDCCECRLIRNGEAIATVCVASAFLDSETVSRSK